jgi:hypothetical protein
MRNSPYLDLPLIPLAVALPRIVADLEAKIATVTPEEKCRLRHCAQVLRDWLALRSTTPASN